MWQLTGREALAELVGVLRASRLPTKKRRELDSFAEALATVTIKGSGVRVSEAVHQRRSEIRDELKRLRVYGAH